MQRSILNLQPGESAHTPAHAAWVEGSHMYLNGNYPIRAQGGGSFSLRLVRYPNGVIAVDLSACAKERFSTVSSFGDEVPRVCVDVALTRPLPDPNYRRICDMACNSFGYVSVASGWIYNNMWLDGQAPISQWRSSQAPLLVERWCDGTYVIDNHFCQDALYQTAWRDESPWPVQVLELIRSTRLH